MRCPTLSELPPAPPGRTGWPWTEESEQLPSKMPDGSPWPRVSIVTPSYNQGQFIEETIRSVLLQGYPNLEYVVVDGASTDGSVEIIRRYQPWLTHWVSEPDKGQGDALVKGFAQSSGELWGWLNSDDCLLPDALERVAVAFEERQGQVVAGDVVRVDEESGAQTIRAQKNLRFRNLVMHWTQDCVYQQPGIFFAAELYRRVGGIDQSLYYAMDYDLLCRFLQHTDTVYVDRPIARFRSHSSSKTATGTEGMFLEMHSVSRRYWDLIPVAPAASRAARHYVARYLLRHAVRKSAMGGGGDAVALSWRALAYCPSVVLIELCRILLSRFGH